MYHTIAEFLDDWSGESGSTLKVLKELTDASLALKVCAEGRTLGFIAWHAVCTLGEMGGKAGLKVDAPAEDAPVPSCAEGITRAYETAAKSLGTQVQARWTDRMLDDELEMYGSKWKRRGVLVSLMRHEIHHRGQMTVLMRQAGLRVPGCYGPSKEEWAGMGMKPLP